MSIVVTPLAPPPAVMGAHSLGPVTAAPSDAAPNFADWLDGSINQVSQNVKAADHEVRSLALGQAESLPQVMMAVENARESVALMVQVRDRVVSAYQALMQMQV